MRIVYICATFPWEGGGEAFFLPEIRELLRLGHELRFLPRSASGRLTPEAEELGPISINAPLFSFEVARAALAEVWSKPLRSLRALRVVLRASPTTALKNLAVFPKALYVSRVANAWGASHIHAQWASTTATIALVASELSSIPWSFTGHRGDIVANNLIGQKVHRAKFVRVISDSGACMLGRALAPEEARKVRCIHMGLDVSRAPPVPIATANRLVLACPANMIPVKGHRYLLEAVQTLAEEGLDCKLRLFGDGELRGQLEAQCTRLGIAARVTFHGHVPRSQLLSAYERGEIGIVVLPSLDLGHDLHEGIPVSLIEAMTYGVPVVSTTTGGIPELLAGNAGMLVPPGDASALARAVHLLATDPLAYQSYATAGRARVESSFDVRSVIRELLSAIDSRTTAEGARR